MRDSRFVLLSFGTILLITLSCYVEEWIFKQLPGFNFHWFVALVELAVFALLGAACEQSCSLQLRTELRKGPLGLYLGTGLSLAASTGLGKLAFRYLNYATGTILKSMKLLPVMLISVLWLRRKYGAQEYISAVLMVTSAALFGLGERSVEPDFSPIGLGLALCVLLSQAIQTNLQDRLLRDYDVSVHEAMLFANASGFVFVLLICVGEGSLWAALAFFASPLAASLLLLRTLTFYAGALCYTALLKHAGGVAAVAVGTVRKSLTVLVSFAFFPKAWSANYGWGCALMAAAIALDQHAYAQRAGRGPSANGSSASGALAGTRTKDSDEELEPCVDQREKSDEELEPCVDQREKS